MANDNIWDGWDEEKMDDTPVFDFQKNKILKGIFIQKKENVGPNGSNLYIFETIDSNERVAVWGNALLDSRLANCMPAEEVGIEYLGKAKSVKSDREYHNFKVYRRPLTEV